VVKPSKLYETLRRSPRHVISFRDFERLLSAAGFALKRRKGSHQSYRHPRIPRILTIQPNGKDAEPYQVAAFVAMVEKYELEFDS
jgi:predicted RNA binding protein YcfA (HicA-like mRNA interferase family)